MLQTIIKIYLVISICLTIAILAFIILFYIARHRNEKIPCNHCKHLVQKGESWKYTCLCPDTYLHSSFDKAPTYCQYFEEREKN